VIEHRGLDISHQASSTPAAIPTAIAPAIITIENLDAAAPKTFLRAAWAERVAG